MNKLILCLSLLCIFLATSCHQKTESASLIKVAATTMPQAQMLEFIKPTLAQKGYQLKIIITDDYNLPNRALAEGDVDANFFQHIPFLHKQIEQFHYDLCILAKTQIEPMGIYSQTLTSLDSIKDRSVIAIPSDPSNEARALQLLEKEGVLRLDPLKKESSTVRDIVSNPKQMKFQELDAGILSRSLQDVAVAVIPTNFALQAGLSPQRDALTLEGSDSLYVNVIVIRCADKESLKLQALKEAMNSRAMEQFIISQYQGAIEPAFILATP